MKLIREHDDFEWVREIPFNPWYGYDGIIFNITPNPEDVKYFIELALNNRKIMNAKDWNNSEMDDDVGKIIGYYNKYGSSSLMIDEEGNLGYRWGDLSTRPELMRYRLKLVLYSDLIDIGINGSEGDNRVSI